MQFFSGVGSIGADAASGGVAFWAHIVGFAVGVLAGLRWRTDRAGGGSGGITDGFRLRL